MSDKMTHSTLERGEAWLEYEVSGRWVPGHEAHRDAYGRPTEAGSSPGFEDVTVRVVRVLADDQMEPVELVPVGDRHRNGWFLPSGDLYDAAIEALEATQPDDSYDEREER